MAKIIIMGDRPMGRLALCWITINGSEYKIHYKKKGSTCIPLENGWHRIFITTQSPGTRRLSRPSGDDSILGRISSFAIRLMHASDGYEGAFQAGEVMLVYVREGMKSKFLVKFTTEDELDDAVGELDEELRQMDARAARGLTGLVSLALCFVHPVAALVLGLFHLLRKEKRPLLGAACLLLGIWFFAFASSAPQRASPPGPGGAAAPALGEAQPDVSRGEGDAPEEPYTYTPDAEPTVLTAQAVEEATAEADRVIQSYRGRTPSRGRTSLTEEELLEFFKCAAELNRDSSYYFCGAIGEYLGDVVLAEDDPYSSLYAHVAKNKFSSLEEVCDHYFSYYSDDVAVQMLQGNIFSLDGELYAFSGACGDGGASAEYHFEVNRVDESRYDVVVTSEFYYPGEEELSEPEITVETVPCVLEDGVWVFSVAPFML